MSSDMEPSVDELAATAPVQLLQALIRYRTVNPPGAERECVEFLKSLLESHGVQVELYGRSAERPNLVARVRGQGKAPPLLLYGHVDVVPTDGQEWSVPPFDGVIKDGFVWGRGTLDMKGGVAMMVCAFLECVRSPPECDVVLAIVSDEEAGGYHGARYLVEAHPELFSGVQHAIGEFGGFTMRMGNVTLFPIQVAEKSCHRITIRARGAGGHASIPGDAGAIQTIARILTALSKSSGRVFVTDAARATIRSIAKNLPLFSKAAFLMLSHRRTARLGLLLLGKRARLFEPLVRATVTPTVVRAGEKLNVIPEQAVIELDTRILPGQLLSEVVCDIKKLAKDAEVEAAIEKPARTQTDLSQLQIFQDVVRTVYPLGVVVPMLLPGTTDARHFDRLGIQTYGFLPMALPEEVRFLSLIHSADERIPLQALPTGALLIERFIRAYRG